MNKVNQWMLKQQIHAKNAADTFLAKGKAVMKNKDGLSHTTEILLWTLAAATVVVTVVGLIILLINDEVLPGLKTKISDILNI